MPEPTTSSLGTTRTRNSQAISTPVSRPVRNNGPVAVFSGGGTGGHLYPALTLAKGLGDLIPDVRPFFIGARKGLEAKVLPQEGLEHLLLPVRGFKRGALLGNLGVLAALIRSLYQTGEAFLRLRPGVVVVTGGYAGGPAGLMAGLMGIPLALQEQNALPGVTTQALSHWARQIHLAFPEALDRLPARSRVRARISGNPIRLPSSEESGSARAHFGLEPDSRLVLIVGGSQGSEALNKAVLSMVSELASGAFTLPGKVQLLWATGPTHLEGIKRGLADLGTSKWLKVIGYIDDMPLALRAADMAVSRAGAMATSEFLAWGLPAVLVPLPTSAENHQIRNAESLASAGTAIHLSQRDATPDALWKALSGLLDDSERLEAMKRSALDRSRPEAASVISGAIATLLVRGGGARS